MNDPDSVGPTLRRLRKQRNIALSEVAGQAGISVATLSRIETNKQGIDVSLLLNLARILGAPAADILGSDVPPEDAGSLSRRGAKELQPALDDLLSAVEVLREELLTVQRAIKRGTRK
jgi:transcriptional regulator with XRE-family HTH domain